MGQVVWVMGMSGRSLDAMSPFPGAMYASPNKEISDHRWVVGNAFEHKLGSC